MYSRTNYIISIHISTDKRHMQKMIPGDKGGVSVPVGDGGRELMFISRCKGL
jgi:hypothetical protein